MFLVKPLGSTQHILGTGILVTRQFKLNARILVLWDTAKMLRMIRYILTKKSILSINIKRTFFKSVLEMFMNIKY